jgi:hypothetical protein
MMKPVKAFLTQDHQAHITVHMAAMQDPKIQQMLQGNPIAPQLQAAMLAHINEHMGFEYRKQIEQQLGMQLPAQKDEMGEDVHMDPQVEAQLAPMLAQAAQQLLQANQAQAAQQAAQQQMQDPMVQLQQQELQLKTAEQQRKEKKDQTDAMFKAEQLKLEGARILAQHESSKGSQKNDMLKTAAQLQATKQQHAIDKGVEVMKQVSQQRHQSGQQKGQHSHQQDQRILNALTNQQMNKPTKGE